MGEWAEQNVKELRDRRWLLPALLVSLGIYALIIWGVASFVCWVL